MSSLIRVFPEWSKILVRRALSIFNSGLYFGNDRFCPLCKRSSRKFKAYGVIARNDARCPHCGSLERHRLLWTFIDSKNLLLDSQIQSMLHFAPEQCLEKKIRESLGTKYITADISHNRADRKIDITNIPYPDQSFQVIYCSHVLEHVPDDRKALCELYRVLDNNGWAILNVPTQGAQTFEDLSITSPQERLKLFGQEDHVRIYGDDYIDRLREANFNVELFQVSDLVNSEEAIKMGLNIESGNIYFCTK